MKCAGPRHEYDRGWAWLVLLASFLVQAIDDGILSAYGLFEQPMLNDSLFAARNYTQTHLSIPGSLMGMSMLVAGQLPLPVHEPPDQSTNTIITHKVKSTVNYFWF
ncbi:hypothetical protein Ciccas_010415 [Cichlidogyrus casuarinus]|uniref:Uncharacterized protein n=1 Tax=Cichlidogyrus casuarinus TaxID=1844966 RepID=A0ABD2PU60_9PLAT